MSRGAELSGRELHFATSRASSVMGVLDDGRKPTEEAKQKHSDRRAMGLHFLEYLPNDLGCDANQLDESIHRRLPYRWGTPLACVAKDNVDEHDNAKIIRLLLAHGADPLERFSWGFNAIDLATDEDTQNYSFIRTIEAFRAEQTQVRILGYIRASARSRA